MPLPLPFVGASFKGFSVGALDLILVRVGIGGDAWGGGDSGFEGVKFEVVGPFSKIWRTRR